MALNILTQHPLRILQATTAALNIDSTRVYAEHSTWLCLCVPHKLYCVEYLPSIPAPKSNQFTSSRAQHWSCTLIYLNFTILLIHCCIHFKTDTLNTLLDFILFRCRTSCMALIAFATQFELLYFVPKKKVHGAKFIDPAPPAPVTWNFTGTLRGIATGVPWRSASP